MGIWTQMRFSIWIQILLSGPRKYSKVDGDFSVCKDSGSGFGVNSVAFRPNDYAGVNGKIKAKVGFNCDHGGEVGYKMEKTQGDRSFMPQGVRLPDYAMMADHHGSYNNSDFSKGIDVYEGFPLKSIGDRNLPIQGLNPKNYKKIDTKPAPVFCDDDHVEIDYRIDKRDRFGKKVNDGWSSSPSGFIPNNCGNIGGKSRSDSLSRALKGSVNGDGVKREADSVALLVSAIEQATESFVKIVDALAKAMLEKTKGKKVEVLSSNSNRNGYTQVAAVDC
ncbi:hypothetical protein OIU78_014167, partial [Salix suchowensis]